MTRGCLRSIGRIFFPNHVTVRKHPQADMLNYIDAHLFLIYGSPITRCFYRKNTVGPGSTPT